MASFEWVGPHENCGRPGCCVDNIYTWERTQLELFSLDAGDPARGNDGETRPQATETKETPPEGGFLNDGLPF